MLKLTRRILDSDLGSAVRCLGTSAPALKPSQTQASVSEEEVFRPAAAQATAMTDMGTRSLFSPDHDMFRCVVHSSLSSHSHCPLPGQW